MDTTFDPIMKVKSEAELNSLLYGEKIEGLKIRASKGDRRAKAELDGELGTSERDYQPSDEGMHWSDRPE